MRSHALRRPLKPDPTEASLTGHNVLLVVRLPCQVAVAAASTAADVVDQDVAAVDEVVADVDRRSPIYHSTHQVIKETLRQRWVSFFCWIGTAAYRFGGQTPNSL